MMVLIFLVILGLVDQSYTRHLMLNYSIRGLPGGLMFNYPTSGLP